MRVSSHMSSRAEHIVCPACGAGKLRVRGPTLAGCGSCGRVVDREIFSSIEQIVALPDALGRHACECGHPEMRRLPDGVFHCPSCGSEVLPIEADLSFPNEAYQAGWMDGHLERIESMSANKGLAVWRDAHERLEYYRGHRAGSKARLRSEDLEKIHTSRPL